MQGTRLYDQYLTAEQEDLVLAREDDQCAECSEQASDCLCDGGEREPDDSPIWVIVRDKDGQLLDEYWD